MDITKTIKRFIHDQWVNYKRIFELEEAQSRLLKGAYLSFYEPGSTQPKNAYQDKELCVLSENPVFADENGLFNRVYLHPTDHYKISLTLRDGTIIETHDRTNRLITSV
jgi:hypothetical protein